MRSAHKKKRKAFPLSSILHPFENLPLRIKLTLVIILTAALPLILVSVFLSGRMFDMVTAETLQKEQVAVAQASPDLEEYLGSISDTTRELRDLFSEDPVLKSLRAGEKITEKDLTAFEDRCRNYLKDSGGTGLRYYIDLPDSAAVYASSSILRPLSGMTATYWYGIFHTNHPAALFCPPLYLSTRERKELGDCACIRPVSFSAPDGKGSAGYLALYFPSSRMTQILEGHLSDEGSVSYLASDRNAIVTSTNPDLAGLYYLDYDQIRDELFSTNGMVERSVIGQKVYVSSCYLSSSSWLLVTVTPSAPLVHKARMVWIRILFLWGLMLISGAASGYVLIQRIGLRITRVSQQMSLVRNGLLIPLEEKDRRDEVGQLVTSYNYMVDQIVRLMEQQKLDAEELRIAEFKTLQAQINPHFLYNTMEMIYWMAQQGRIKELGMAVRDLSKFYRLTLSRKESISTIAEEIEHVTLYTRLQNMRFGNTIDFVVDVPDFFSDYSIPRLTLQPLVENSILHGILEKESHAGTIVLTGWEEKDHIILLLFDNGVGIPAEKIAALMTPQTASGKGAHIALYNTHRRIRLLYGEAYGLTLRSRPGEGTEVEIRLPAENAAPKKQSESKPESSNK